MTETIRDRGRHYDIILEAMEIYRGFMLDDDFDAQRCLDAIMKRMKERLEMSDPPVTLCQHTDLRRWPSGLEECKACKAP
jgi:hypothetical protein